MPDQLERLTAALADRYAIEREIGAGGMATVYLAEDLRQDWKTGCHLHSSSAAPERTEGSGAAGYRELATRASTV